MARFRISIAIPMAAICYLRCLLGWHPYVRRMAVGVTGPRPVHVVIYSCLVCGRLKAKAYYGMPQVPPDGANTLVGELKPPEKPPAE